MKFTNNFLFFFASLRAFVAPRHQPVSDDIDPTYGKHGIKASTVSFLRTGNKATEDSLLFYAFGRSAWLFRNHRTKKSCNYSVGPTV